jgi:hypothetical protein
MSGASSCTNWIYAYVVSGPVCGSRAGSRSGSRRSTGQELADRSGGKAVSLMPLARAGTGDIEDANVVLIDEARDPECDIRFARAGCVDHEVRLGVASTQIARQARATGKRTLRDDHGAVAVDHVLQCAFGVASPGQRTQRIPLRDHSVFGSTIRRTPATAREAGLECSVERATIHSRLAAADDPFKRHRIRPGKFGRESLFEAVSPGAGRERLGGCARTRAPFLLPRA